MTVVLSAIGGLSFATFICVLVLASHQNHTDKRLEAIERILSQIIRRN